MCGVAGIWNFKEIVEKDEIMSFTDSMRHRGPDSSGYEIFDQGHLALGHRRLSILDLTENGKQPLSYANGRYWLTFNGEIYNFIEIKSELLLKGYTFISDTDSEVILASYVLWGTKCFDKFNGMWAIGIWDNDEKQLILCRDRFGVKPLHYCYVPGRLFAFASETLAFKYLKKFTRSYDQNNLMRAVESHNILEPAGETIYKNVFQLLPGSYLLINSEGKLHEAKWWSITNYFKPAPGNFIEQKEQFLSLFSDACRLRLRSDVPLASALSGGIDSTAVYCMLGSLMAEGKNQTGKRVPHDWQKAFSVSFPGSRIDEKKYVQALLDQTNGKGIITEPAYENLTTELIHSTRMSDFISGTPLSSLTYVYKSMHSHGIKVSLDGHGADEYLYGYNSSVAKALLQAYLSGDHTYSKDLEAIVLEMNFVNAGRPIIQKVQKQAAFILDRRKSIKYALKDKIKKVRGEKKQYYTLSKSSKNILFSGQEYDVQKCLNVESYFNLNENLGEQQLLEEFHYWDLPYNLRDFDRVAMQNQVEVRMPFMDYRLVTYTFSLPQKSKLNNGFTKYILRESMKGIMPEDIRTRKLKIGLGAPIADWFNGGLNTFLPDLIHTTKKDVSLFNWQYIKETVEYNCKNKCWSEDLAIHYWPVINYLLLEL